MLRRKVLVSLVVRLGDPRSLLYKGLGFPLGGVGWGDLYSVLFGDVSRFV